jgi:integrase
VVAALAPFSGRARSHTLIALRSLFGFLHRDKRIFRNPTLRLAPGSVSTSILFPIDRGSYREVVAAATTPQHRVVLALAAVHAARPAAIRAIRLNDIELGQRRITVDGVTRRIDDLTYRTLINYLDHRRRTWPNTANPHLLLNSRTARDARPVSTYTINRLFFGVNATLDRLRSGRQLEEALQHGPDPLHLAAVFGLSHATAIRYAEAVRRILASEEAQDAAYDDTERSSPQQQTTNKHVSGEGAVPRRQSE